MTTETLEQKIFARFHTWDIESFPPAGIVKPYAVDEQTLLHLAGAHIGHGGRLEWRGDRLKIDQHGDAGTITRWTDYQGHLCVVIGTNLYVLRSDWDALHGTSQWAYGYEIDLAADASGNPWSWDDALALGAACEVTEIKDILLLTTNAQATKRYDGTDVTQVGILPPQTGFTVKQDFTADYDAGADAGGVQGVAQYKITNTAAPDNATDVWVHSKAAIFGADGLRSVLFEWEFQFSAASGAEARVHLVGMGNVAAEDRADWGTHICAGILYHDFGDGNKYYAFIGDVDSDTSDSARPLTVSTTYYARLVRTGNQNTFSVYSDSARTTLVAEVADQSGGTPFQYLYAASTYGTGGAATTMSSYVENLYAIVATVGTGQLATGTYSYYFTWGNNEFESMPSPIIDVVASADDKNISLSGITVGPAGTTWRKLYRAYTSVVTVGARGETFQYLGTIDDNTTTTFTDNSLPAQLGEGIAFDHALPPRGGIAGWYKDRAFIAAPYEESRSYPDYETDATKLQNALFYSPLDEPYYWPGQNYMMVGDKKRITTWVSWNDYLYLFKEDSIWVLSGYGEDSWVLEKLIDAEGIGSPYGEQGSQVAVGREGIVWAAMDGIYWYNGANVTLILKKGDRYKEPYSTFGSMVAYADGYFYIQLWAPDAAAWYLFRWHPLDNTWQCQYFAGSASGYPKLLGVNRDPYNTHVIAYMPWIAAGANYITVLDGGQIATGENLEGSSYSDLYAPVAITLPPLIAEPGEEIIPRDIWIDGDWVIHATEAKRVKLYINTNADYSTGSQGDAPQDGKVVGIPPGTSGTVIYVQLAGEYAKGFVLNAVGIRYIRRKARGA